METVIPEGRSEAGIVAMNGREYMVNAKGDLVAISNVKAQHKLEDQTVRSCIGFAEELSAQIGRFKGHTAADLAALDAILAEQYQAKIGGRKGNRTYQTFDGLLKVQVQVADQIVFGPELHVAKALIDECLNEWSADSRPEIQSIVTRAFNVDKEGQVNRADVFMLLKLEIDDPRWNRAMDAIRDAIKVTGSKEYVRFYKRADKDADWVSITIDLARA